MAFRAYALWWDLKGYLHSADMKADDDSTLEKPDMVTHIRFSFLWVTPTEMWLDLVGLEPTGTGCRALSRQTCEARSE
jgi:hypothetical protein